MQTIPVAEDQRTGTNLRDPQNLIKVNPLTRHIGAELFDVQIPDITADDDLFAEVQALLHRYRVLFLRDQDITRAEHSAFARRFGPLEEGHPSTDADSGLILLYKDETTEEHYENAYHTDTSWRETPSMASVLRCVETPEVGGDTIWVNMVQAYRDLPEHVKSQIGGLKARHSFEATFGAARPIEIRHRLREQFPDPEHPVVRTHPETGEKILYVNTFTTHFTNFHTPENVQFGTDYTPAASNLLNYLHSRVAIPEYQVRWRWTKNSVALWDNRATQHYAVQDYWPAVRKMERATIIGEKPF
ncbi:taurine dioxygenase [Nocardia cyriacigeorgica]|uniref:Taurine dioxygenase n=1 Tax=Nocardia cyriacigeorgica TaxID=135487 RepID=A0ABX0CL64_9NOCA|nr:TauD/TfdA family dioxygenase [Nocardia cyriacigeorgica]NEW37648.1 taurine dioxygenase [Nocardia cyriacigeorgica]NEW48964.1 taurine dioxygenase [Nocardia cyriacigeorgica]NEW55065.1 taurine dioxygenase [Nocardia cyriacigeorgica]